MDVKDIKAQVLDVKAQMEKVGGPGSIVDRSKAVRSRMGRAGRTGTHRRQELIWPHLIDP